MKNTFQFDCPNLGLFNIRPLRPQQDNTLLHQWFSAPYAQFWCMGHLSAAEIGQHYQHMATSSHATAYLGYWRETPLFLLELYQPQQDEISHHYAVEQGDIGMHFLLAPKPEQPVHGLSLAVLQVIMRFIFTDPSAQRVVVEPDIHNCKIHPLNRKVGFRYQYPVCLSYKTAHLAFCRRQDFIISLYLQSSENAMSINNSDTIYPHAIQHIRSPYWQDANRHVVRKIISEFTHEKIIFPQKNDTAPNRYTLAIAGSDMIYTFNATAYWLDHLDIDAASITLSVAGQASTPDALQLILALRQQLAISDTLLPIYMDEITATVNGLAYKYAAGRPDAKMLAQADYQTVEISMDEGHPVFVANNGRIGFDTLDYLRYAPECGTPQRLIWIAVHKAKTVFSCLSDLDWNTLIKTELSAEVMAKFFAVLHKQGVCEDDYYWMPVHEWQWREKITTRFTPDLAVQNIIFLGVGPEQYYAQQSIRTFFNISNPQKCYVKTALSILNMGFMRGLSPYFMSATPQINQWIEAFLDSDPYFAEKGFRILKEIAAIGFHDSNIEQAIAQDTPYKKMLSALWRESPLTKIQPGQRLMTMASLLHVDQNGRSVVAELIASSGLSASAWVEAYLDVYLAPLLHGFYAHDLIFMPHGENLILILEHNRPVGVFMKDIAEEVGIVNSTTPVPEYMSRIQYTINDDMKGNHVFLDIFDCFFRFLVPLLQQQADLPQAAFWRLVCDCIQTHQQRFPEYQAKYQQYNLFKPDFVLNCMNRLQLNNNQQMVDWGDWEKNFKFAGTIDNPLLLAMADNGHTEAP